jgi:hypothetical protein
LVNVGDAIRQVKQKKLAAELANGRLAMMAIIGMFFQNGLTGDTWRDMKREDIDFRSQGTSTI